MPEVKNLYEEAFGKETKVKFDNAVHSLWEDHCKHRNPREWPPTSRRSQSQDERNGTLALEFCGSDCG